MNSQNKNDRAAWLQGPSAKCSTLPEFATLCWRLVLLGAPGVGKGTQAQLLNQRLGACHLSTGDVFRAARSRKACEHTPAMAAALDYMRRGDLVPDSTVWEMVRECSGCLHCQGGFVLDGFPRTLGQAGALSQLVEKENPTPSAVVNYELRVAEIVSRLGGRRICEKCKAVFHVTRQPSRSEGICEACGGRLYQREDDRPESVKPPLEVYENSTGPLIKFYSQLGLLVPVAATGSPEENLRSHH
jgi:adenylate kinase